MLKLRSIVSMAIVLTASVALAQVDWSSMPYTPVSSYQAVNSDGSSAYSGGFPVRMIGVVINNTEDWLDPSANNFFSPYSFSMGGQSELIVQAVNPGDFGGVFCWMGQNYGNTYRADPGYSYTNEEWTAELGRLNLYGGDGVTDPIRAGTLVEIRANTGLNYGGKMNVNEAHNNDRPGYDLSNAAPTDGTGASDFDIIVLDTNYGMPDAMALQLSDLKYEDDSFIFDADRLIGGERYQATWVELQDVWITSAVNWACDTDISVTDGVRTFNVYLGLNSSFDGTEIFAPGEHFNVKGIVDQSSDTGMDGYQLLALDADNFTPVPEPLTLAMLATGSLAVIICKK